jgi:hypothetical protein
VPHAEKIIKTFTLAGGVLARLSDLTSHYFGGYYHVRILVRADVPVSAVTFDGAPDYQDAVKRLGQTVSFSRTLEKMAVPDSEIDSVRQQLLTSFDANVLPYLMRNDFADRFVRSEYRKALKSRPVFHRESP